MKSHVPVALSFLGLTNLCAAANTESGYLATITLAPTASGAAAFDLEEKRAECFQSCYKTYGNFNSCSRGGLEKCWCNASVDWVEREEDCVWSICGPSAYNEYATVLSRVCERLLRLLITKPFRRNQPLLMKRPLRLPDKHQLEPVHLKQQRLRLLIVVLGQPALRHRQLQVLSPMEFGK
ncbi:hypothetical protein NXS19_009430 [Fusarium pseudograminearum]|nr:hypothetical protein NXS19_009430 [Fusarium pseudograminearum]